MVVSMALEGFRASRTFQNIISRLGHSMGRIGFAKDKKSSIDSASFVFLGIRIGPQTLQFRSHPSPPQNIVIVLSSILRPSRY